MQWYTYLIDSLLDFRNSSNAANDNELDSDFWRTQWQVPVQWSLVRANSEKLETSSNSRRVAREVVAREGPVAWLKLMTAYRIMSSISLQNYSFLQQSEFQSTRIIKIVEESEKLFYSLELRNNAKPCKYVFLLEWEARGIWLDLITSIHVNSRKASIRACYSATLK